MKLDIYLVTGSIGFAKKLRLQKKGSVTFHKFLNTLQPSFFAAILIKKPRLKVVR